VVDVGCRYMASLTYPETVTAGLRVAHLGRSSVRYEVALFGEGSEEAAAEGHFVHVYVDRASRRPVELPAKLRATLEPLLKR
jgi:acyl-CoA thioester hydrolase